MATKESGLPQPVGSPANEMFVNLCTDAKTYFLRQVSSSNSTLMVRPRSRDAGTVLKGSEESLQSETTGTCSIIASCKGQLEIMGTPEWYDGKPFLMKALELWQQEDSGANGKDPDSACTQLRYDTTDQGMAVQKLLDDIPVSTAECIQDWIALCAFVNYGDTDSQLHCYRPSASTRLKAWHKVMESSILAEMDLCREFLIFDLWNAILDSEGGQAPFPETVFEAMMRCCCRVQCTTLLDLCQRMRWGRLDKEVTVAWTGSTLLEASAPRLTSAMNIDEFISRWKDLLPESWREEAALNRLKGNYAKTVDGGRVYFQITIDKTVRKKK
ncbi:hypothetical protein KEM54_001551 [Ascosphaera aggregata]|nr:hypothetical protein KEM54_001551 [Ascosphaera aggregata]